MAEPADQRKISVILSTDLLAQVDELRKQWGMRSRGPALERLLLMVLSTPESLLDGETEPEPEPEHLQGALVLVREPGYQEDPSADGWPEEEESPGDHRPSGIDLPGFVQKRSSQLRRSLKAPVVEQVASEHFQVMDSTQLQAALLAVQQHWSHLYGTAPGQAVLEAAMHWLGCDIWPSSDAADGQAFTWNALQQVLVGYVPSWELRDPSVDRVVVAAGVLEDPFGAPGLPQRIPSLVGRMVQRLRRRRRGTPFLDLQSTMSTTGALKLLKLPTAPGHSLTLNQIREAYRLQALDHHPDAGGDPEEMRRLNEAYQLLKQQYRKPA
ncbi:MAG: DnaJ domain-containing protein [Synechococcus lacustris]